MITGLGFWSDWKHVGFPLLQLKITQVVKIGVYLLSYTAFPSHSCGDIHGYSVKGNSP